MLAIGGSLVMEQCRIGLEFLEKSLPDSSGPTEGEKLMGLLGIDLLYVACLLRSWAQE
jgi:hypothetical protein